MIFAGPLVPTQFPVGVLTDPDVPKSVKSLNELPHGEVRWLYFLVFFVFVHLFIVESEG